VGAIGHCGTFSFQASKNLNAGEGGMIITNDEQLADKLWSVANVGRTRTGKWYEHHVLGGNFRMTEWQAAILLTQLKRVPEQTRLRNENGAYLNSKMSQIPGIITFPDDPRVSVHGYHLYAYRYTSSEFGGRSRQQFLEAMHAEGIPGFVGYAPLYEEVVFQRKSRGEGSWCQFGRQIDYSGVNCPVCKEIYADTIWMGQSTLLGTREDMDDVVKAVKKIQAAWA
jgi:dTDP-4-amino-4,6-dideoxygalactose transaminase